MFAQVFISLVLVASGVFGSSLENDRIHGGSFAKNGQFPFVAQVRRVSVPSHFPHHCDAAILSERFAVTVASCDEPEETHGWYVVLGVTKGSRPNEEGYAVEKWILHENFRRDITNTTAVLVNDIALLKTYDKIEFNSLVAPIALHDGFISHNLKVTALGWESDDDIHLKFLGLRTLTNRDCHHRFADKFGRRHTPTSTQHTLCALSVNDQHSLCLDLGAPLVLENKLVGLSIFPAIDFAESCTGQLPAGFTRISEHVEWIQKHIKLSN